MLLDDSHHEQSSEASLISRLRQGHLPQHIAIIMDGNGRWAKARGCSRIVGHREGVESARDAVMVCQKLGIPALTLYAFSLENWRRPKHEIALLMELFAEFFQHHCNQFLQKGVRFRAIGRLELLPGPLQVMIQELEAASQGAEGITVTLALSYGGRDEIVTAVNQVVKDTVQGKIGEDPLNEARFAQYLSTSDLPDPDLVIRTSGESRVSNFLLWQIAYSELYFTNILWPDFRQQEMLLALTDYQTRDRRLGGLNSASQGSEELSMSGELLHMEASQMSGRISSQFKEPCMQHSDLMIEHDHPSLVTSWLE
ncbi:MAG: isoprenyl transferase [Nitrospirales bacterium]